MSKLYDHKYLLAIINIVSFVAMVLLYVPCNFKLILVSVLVAILVALLFTRYASKVKYHPLIVILCILYSVSLAMGFKTKWIFFEGIGVISSYMGVDSASILYFVGTVLAVLGFWAMLTLAENVFEFFNSREIRILDFRERKTNYLLIAVFAMLIVTFSTTCSFLYKYHTWGDSNIFFTIGKAMLSGVMPYRDLFDQKGPVVFMLHALGALISYKSFFGIYILQLVNCFFYLLFIYKTNGLFFNRNNYLNTLMLGVLTYVSLAYSTGDSVEEFSLAIIMYAIYVALKNCIFNTVPSKTELVMIGITSGLVFWMKYTIIGFYAGWILIPAIREIKDGNIKRLFNSIVYIILGVLITTAVIFAWFGLNGCIVDMLRSYFLENMSGYSNGLGILGCIYNIFFHGLISILENNVILFVFCIIGMCQLPDVNGLRASVISMFLFMVFTIYFGGRYMAYYCLILSPFALFGVSSLMNYVTKKVGGIMSRRMVSLAYVVLIVMLFVLCNNSTGNLNRPYEDYLQYNVNKTIESTGTDNPTILYYGMLEKGFHNFTGDLPNVKYYFVPNMMYDEIIAIQDEYIEDGLVDFVFTKDEKEYPGYEFIEKYEDKYYLYGKAQ